MLTLGLDIGGTTVKAAGLRGGHALSVSQSAPYDAADASALRGAVQQAIAQLALPGRPDAVGLCVPGVLDEGQGVVTASVNVPALVGLPLADLVREALGSSAPVRAATDAHAAAIDVFIARHLQGRLLAVSLGTGVGACVLDDGEALRVTGTSSGHFGQIDVTLPEDAAEPPIGPDGGAGALEAYLGARVLERRFGSPLPAAGLTLDARDPALRALAKGLRIAHAIYRPNHIAFVGGVGLALRPSLSALQGLVANRLTSLARPGWTLTGADDAFHAARGAARLAAARVTA